MIGAIEFLFLGIWMIILQMTIRRASEDIQKAIREPSKFEAIHVTVTHFIKREEGSDEWWKSGSGEPNE